MDHSFPTGPKPGREEDARKEEDPMRNRLLAVAAAGVLIVAACSSTPGSASPGAGGSAAPGDWQAGGGEAWDTVLAAGRGEGTVVVGGPAFLGEAMAEAFKADTGITLEWIGA